MGLGQHYCCLIHPSNGRSGMPFAPASIGPDERKDGRKEGKKGKKEKKRYKKNRSFWAIVKISYSTYILCKKVSQL